MIGAPARHTDVLLRNDWKGFFRYHEERASSEPPQRGAARGNRPSPDHLHGFWAISPQMRDTSR